MVVQMKFYWFLNAKSSRPPVRETSLWNETIKKPDNVRIGQHTFWAPNQPTFVVWKNKVDLKIHFRTSHSVFHPTNGQTRGLNCPCKCVISYFPQKSGCCPQVGPTKCGISENRIFHAWCPNKKVGEIDICKSKFLVHTTLR